MKWFHGLIFSVIFLWFTLAFLKARPRIEARAQEYQLQKMEALYDNR